MPFRCDVEEQEAFAVSPVPAPYQLLSWWDMKPFPVIKILRFVRALEREGKDFSSDEKPVAETGTDQKKMLKDTEEIAKDFEEFSLPATADQLRRMGEGIEKNITNAEMRKFFPDLLNRLEDECNRLLFMRIESAHLQYFENSQFFDSNDPEAKKVSIEFPSAAEDIAEAGKCLACGRSTACVMHLNRIVEVGLRALANALGIDHQNDWGAYLREIDKELEKRKQASGARTVDEQFYSEVALTIDSVRRAWRNPTMHVERTYTVERAEEILIAVRSLMRHLAQRLHD